MANVQTRRNFLRTAPIAAAVSLPLANQLFSATPAAAQTPSAPEKFQIFTAQAIADDSKTLQAQPGNNNLFDPKSLPVNMVLTSETAKIAKEFEWHEGRDHIVQILEGTTVYEVGGTPEGSHNVRPGEWLAPKASGITKYTMKKGDVLVIPRGTLHKRSTEGTVTFTLISTTGALKS